MFETDADKLLLDLQVKEIEQKDIDKLTDAELLKYLMDLIVHYDYLKDRELQLIDDEDAHKNRYEWSGDVFNDYEDLKLAIDTYFCRIRDIARSGRVYGMKDFWYC